MSPGAPRDGAPPAGFDVVVVGAGPAGSAAAIVLARAGRSVCLIERGAFPGAKNMFGGVVYGGVLDPLVPTWREEAPLQRWVTRRVTMLMTPTQALSLDMRTEAWGAPPYNGATALRPQFDRWLAGKAVEAGAELVCSTVATGLWRDRRGRVAGVTVDRPDGEGGDAGKPGGRDESGGGGGGRAGEGAGAGGSVAARVVIACDGVNSLLAKEAGLRPSEDPDHITLGVKEVLGLPRETIESRFNVRGRDGVDIEILGATGGIAGGGFVYTNLDTVAVGVVLQLSGLARAKRRPEDVIADLKRHPAIAPLVEGGELLEYSAHLIPEGGYDSMPDLAADGLLVAGDAAAMTMAAGIWLEGVNFAVAAGAAAGAAAAEAIASGDVSREGLAGYRTRLEASFVLKDHRRLRAVPKLILSRRVQEVYPGLLCDLVEGLFTVDNSTPKPGLARIARRAGRRRGLRLGGVVSDGVAALRSFG